MMKASLSWAALAAAASILVGMGACGGKVVADGITGNGGAGGAGGSSSTIQPVTSTSTGPTTNSSVSVGPTSVSSGPPVCSCQAMCQNLQACGLSGPECPSYCDQIPPSVQGCVCQSAGLGCGAVEQCFSGTGPGPTTTGVGGGGGGITPECADCANQQPCDMQAGQCFDNAECQALVDCASGCDWGFGCLNGCVSQHPNGGGAFSTLVNCAICGSCYEVCATSSLAGYCFDGG